MNRCVITTETFGLIVALMIPSVDLNPPQSLLTLI